MRKQPILILAVVVTFGMLLPWYKGLDFLDPVMIVAYSCLALLFVAPASTEAFAPARGIPTPGESIRRIATVLAYGWGVTVIILAMGIATVNLRHWHGSILSPPATLLIASLLLGLTACLAVGGLCSLLVRRLTVRSVKGIVRLMFLILLAALAFGNRFLPEQTRESVSARMTTEGITHLAFVASAVLACVGGAFVAAAVLLPAGREPESA